MSHRSRNSVAIGQASLYVRQGFGFPPCRVVLFQIELAAHRTYDHRCGNPQLLWPDGEIHVHDHQGDETDPGESVQHMHQAPSHIREKVWIAREKDGAHAKHHEHPRADYSQPGEHDNAVIKLVLERILAKLPWKHTRFAKEALKTIPCIFKVGAIGPDRPEIHEEGGVNDVKENRNRENSSGDPVVDQPIESKAHLWQERGE